jgi:tetratricopeptide (TPR) repeat protein
MKTVEGTSEPTKSTPPTADEFAGRGSARMTKGDIDGAIADLSEAIRLAPQRTDLLTMRMRAYQRAGKRSGSERRQRRSCAQTERQCPAVPPRVAASSRRGSDRRHGRRRCRRCRHAENLARHDASRRPLRTHGQGRSRAGPDRPDDHAPSRRQQLSRPAQHALLEPGSANVDLNRALDDCTAAIRKSRGEPGYLDSRTLVHLRRKDYAAAITDADAALALRPDMANTLFLRALAKFKAGQENGGKDDLAAARKLSPEIDTHYSAYGLVAPIPPAGPTARIAPDTDDDDNQ